MDNFLHITPHSLALLLAQEGPSPSSPSSSPAAGAELWERFQHHTGYEVFSSFKAANTLQFWNKALTAALAEVFFLGWIDEHVLLIQSQEEHLRVLRNAWTRRTLKPPQGFSITSIGG